MNSKVEVATAMDDAEPYDLITVLLRLEGLKGMAHEIGRQSSDELDVPATDGRRTGLFRTMLASLRSWP